MFEKTKQAINKLKAMIAEATAREEEMWRQAERNAAPSKCREE
jgi:hypothetical protein